VLGILSPGYFRIAYSPKTSILSSVSRLTLARPSRLFSQPWRALSTYPLQPAADNVASPILSAVSLANSVAPATSNTSLASPSLLPQRPGAPNPLFVPPPADPLLTLLASVVMRHGEKHKAVRLITDTLSYLHTITLCSPLPILREAIDLVAPSVKVVTLRKPSKNVLSPRPLTERQRTKQAFRWILTASEKRPDRSVSERLAKEVVNIIRGESDALKRKEEVHRQAAVNRANAPRR